MHGGGGAVATHTAVGRVRPGEGVWVPELRLHPLYSASSVTTQELPPVPV